MRKFSKIASIAAICLTMSFMTVPVSAVDLNDVGNSSSVSASVDSGSSDDGYVDVDTFKTLYGDTTITQEEAAQAATVAKPVVKVIRTAMSFLLAILPALMLFNAILDILCLTVSPLRNAMMSVQGGSSGGGGGMGMMGGMGGMGGASGGAGGQPTGILQTIGQWASKEAVDAVQECGGGASGGAGGGMGGMGMMGGMGGGAAAPAKPKMLLMCYFKKKTVFLVLFGVCIIAFSCTAFTDLGLKMGEWIVTHVNGVNF